MKQMILIVVLLNLVSHTALAQPPARVPDSTPVSPNEQPSLQSGHYLAWLDSPGGPLNFGIRIESDDESVRGWLINGKEESQIPDIRFDGDDVIFDFVHYNSHIRAKSTKAGRSLAGVWKKVQGHDRWTEMDFHAIWQAPRVDRDLPDARKIRGRIKPDVRFQQNLFLQATWSVTFESSDDPAIAMFEATGDGRVTGTFMTTTGDYRFLGGTFADQRLELSVFDGAHAFLFIADVAADFQSMSGDFWSRDSWHETWTAQRDPDATLPDAFLQTKWKQGVSLADLRYPDLEGELQSLADPEYAGRVRILEVFGTWCPNCNDATKYLIELHEQYAARGLSILGLAFEMTGDPLKDAAQVKRYVDHHGIPYPILLAGTSDKTEATKAFPMIDRVRSYPTFIFLDAENNVKAIYTGFTGPATGNAYDKLREDFERIIERMLGE